MGGYICQQIAQNHLKRLLSMTTISSGPIGATDEFVYYGCQDCGDCSLPKCAHLCTGASIAGNYNFEAIAKLTPKR